MRDLNAKQNIIEIQDPVSGDVHEFYYRLPTTQERVAFQNKMVIRKGNKVLVRKDLFAVYVECGALILTGFKPGTLSRDGRLISPDPESPDYCEGWKDLLVKSAPDMLAVIGRVVFTGAQVAGTDAGFEFEFAEVEGDDAPLAS